MSLVHLFYEFFKTGLFSVGGGLATLPFLAAIGRKTGWFGTDDLANMVAVSESTPGPLGVNMATYVGFTTMGIIGSITASTYSPYRIWVIFTLHGNDSSGCPRA